MADWYVDPAATGANNGTSQTDAWTSIVSALASASVVSGDIVWCKGTQVLTANLTQTAQASGIIFRAVNASWISNGTPFVIDGNNTYTIFNWGTARNNTWEYFTLRRAATGCYFGTNTGSNVFIGCLFELNPANAGSGAGSTVGQFYRCVFKTNTSVGGASLNSSLFDSCVFQNNTTAFTTSGAGNRLVNCHIIDNTNGSVSTAHLDNCIIDGNSNIGITTPTGGAVTVSRCRITNNGTGVTTGTNGGVYLLDCVVSDNTTNQTTGSGGVVRLLGDTVIANGLSQYIDRANKNFGLLSGAILRRTAKTTLSNVLTVDYVTAGIQGADIIYPRIISAVPNVLPTVGGTVRLTYADSDSTAGLTAANITADGVAASSISIVSGTVVDITFGALTAGQKDIVAISTAGTATVYEAITVQAGASAPGAPAISERYTLSNKVAINILPPTRYEYIDIYRDAVLLEAEIDDPTLYEDTTVVASTAYVYTAKARNSTGTGVASNALTLTTTASNLPIEERIVKGMKELTEGMLISNGYFYNWQTANTQDEAKIETYPAVVKIEGTTEENTDEDNSIDSLSYSNMMNVTIHCVGKLTAEPTNPKDAIRLVINKMLVDLKKLFGTYYYINDEAETEMIFYKGYEYKDNPARDIFDPIQLITNWKIRYRQKRTNPLVNIL